MHVNLNFSSQMFLTTKQQKFQTHDREQTITKTNLMKKHVNLGRS